MIKFFLIFFNFSPPFYHSPFSQFFTLNSIMFFTGSQYENHTSLHSFTKYTTRYCVPAYCFARNLQMCIDKSPIKC